MIRGDKVALVDNVQVTATRVVMKNQESSIIISIYRFLARVTELTNKKSSPGVGSILNSARVFTNLLYI
jgi:hypothetical protein